ncbi:MAG: DEAD/DEAH box helicase [Akkermansiaceae bacterium]|nr:DEAD/DEAH box helicase [Verrucomicrobiae bacterium]MCP5552699.1 DEAD/DEAH box helicase [Akkermansiaceae bacterium]
MHIDKATADYLNSFPEPVRREGRRLQDEGAVVSVHGSHLFIKGRVEATGTSQGDCVVTLRLRGNEWEGACSCPRGLECPSLCAVMLKRLALGADLPESPATEDSLPIELLEKSLGRPLTGHELEFLDKVERRFRRYQTERRFFDHDMVRLNPRWPVESYEPLEGLWPVPPESVQEFWNYIAYAMQKRGLQPPEFLSAATDEVWAADRMVSWERERERSAWRSLVDNFVRKPLQTQPEPAEFRLCVAGREARLQWHGESGTLWQRVANAEEFKRLKQRYQAGGLRMSAASEILWSQFLPACDEEGGEGWLNLDQPENCRLLNRLLHQPEIGDAVVNLDEEPYRIQAQALRWKCARDSMGSEDYEILLVTDDGEPISHSLRLLPGEENLYLADEVAFPGPVYWEEEQTLVDPRQLLPPDVVETEAGVAFLARIAAGLPDELAARIRVETIEATIQLRIVLGLTGRGTEHIVARVTGRSTTGSRREILGKEGWEIATPEEGAPTPEPGIIQRYDRTPLAEVPERLAALGFTWDAGAEGFRTRLTRAFPEKYLAWSRALPETIHLELDKELATLEHNPVEASVSFEVVGQEIDWFDLKVVVQVEGLDLTPQEIRALVAARGAFVRLANGGWLRLEMKLSDQQREAVHRIGLDPFDLSGETHRMHVLQLAEPLAQEVFDEAAWQAITERSREIRLSVQPPLPDGLSVTLRPYQVDGFHFLAYLAENGFGGILADDMGLGKTIQSLTWLLWLRKTLAESGDPNLPSLVVCPKSVLDVWEGEVRKAAPGLRIQVLRNRAEFDAKRIREELDLVVMNYAQLRVNAEDLDSVHWLAAILDEGQQIKNPDSQAAKAARQIQARHRLVLSGTPIENRLLDVWSLMSFAMPGILGNRKYFRDRFDRRKDPDCQPRLTSRLRPFLLRRAKSEVALDLPPKTEEDVLCIMEGVQQQLYLQELERIQKVLLDVGNEDSLRRNSFIILQGLMRLRQICCHPGLVSPAAMKEESAKLSALFYLLDQLRDEGHKVLVFSQFVSMLNIIQERLVAEDRPHVILTGQTRDRQQVIDTFQSSKDPMVFLLSLKAGGSGLNLTSASYVVLYDPWWNPAVENQAIDRTHRIGQENKVIAYRLLIRDSVEEKIRLLQQQKRELVSGVLGEEGFARNLSMDDLAFLFSQGNR